MKLSIRRGDSLVRATTTASSLEAEQDSCNIAQTQTKATSNEPSSQGTSSSDGPRRQDTMGDTSAHTRLKHIELMKICTTLQKKVLDLEDELKRTKTAQQTKGLERRVKKLEKKHMSRTHKLKRLYKVSFTARVISSPDDEALDKEDTSKQERIDEIDADEDIALVSTHDDINKGIEDVGDEEVVEVVSTAKVIINGVVNAAQVTIAIVDILVSAAETIVTTALTITTESTKTNVKLVPKTVLLCSTKRTMCHGRLVFSGDINREVHMNETFHVQTDDELTEKELKQIEADDQAIHTIILDLPKDIYAAVNSCETA
nr:ribonuclease H-like domain-containing protein [Tanacetum cinerariifolium]